MLAPCRVTPWGDPHGADPMPTDLGEAVLERAVTAYAEALGDRLVAGYALGSLAHGGFSPLVSDVDLGLILADPLRAGDHATIGEGGWRRAGQRAGAARAALGVLGHAVDA